MTIRKLFFLFWTTLAIGTVTAPVMGWVIQGVFGPLGLTSVRLLWAGVMFGAVAQMGFFAYMVFNMVAKGFIRNPRLYQGIQLILTVLILIRILDIPAETRGLDNTWLIPWSLPVMILLFGLVVAWFKVKATQPAAFIPAIFFMVGTTVVEAIPALGQQSFPMILLMVMTLLVCNTWQIMQLHRLVGPTSEKGKQKSQTSGSGA
ncbi:MAG: KinB-signaling pathway activation protein [Firmicutes bacterium]|jgi:KinB signaling pathway activation protein|uniref:KinB signaling pathway activation protein n=1 Tax=Melghirimyces thermohalophilus TaxID=1236220 RepID=A0A1G6PHZ2_9BACL|nr:KinB-signaling pathway activation protein [Melghirimyces thermohalophilus]MDA8353941.1 KinB-signaling pathway activation protein [Bacillota bacterium]SDC79146.1 KinB signaling pathway activation protein [Melghirimyces thermohalophilus]